MTTPPPEGAEPTSAEAPAAAEGAVPSTAPPAPPPPVPETSPAGSWGPPGKTRNWLGVAVLSIITCGIYYIFWCYYVFRDNKEHSGDGVGGGLGALFGFFSIISYFVLPNEIENIYRKAGKTSPVSALIGLWNLLPLVGFFIWVYKVQTAINDRWEEVGAVRTA